MSIKSTNFAVQDAVFARSTQFFALLVLATLVSIAPVLVIFLVAQRYLVTGLTAGATKG